MHCHRMFDQTGFLFRPVAAQQAMKLRFLLTFVFLVTPQRSAQLVPFMARDALVPTYNNGHVLESYNVAVYRPRVLHHARFVFRLVRTMGTVKFRFLLALVLLVTPQRSGNLVRFCARAAHVVTWKKWRMSV